MTVRPVRIDWESYMFVLFSGAGAGGVLCGGCSETGKKKEIHDKVFIKDGTKEAEIIPICGWYNISAHK